MTTHRSQLSAVSGQPCGSGLPPATGRFLAALRQRLPVLSVSQALGPDPRGRFWNLLLLRVDWHPFWRVSGGLVLNLRTRASADDVANTWPLRAQQRLEADVRAAVAADDFGAFARAYRRAANRGMVQRLDKPALRHAYTQLRTAR